MCHAFFAVFAFKWVDIEDVFLLAVGKESRKEQGQKYYNHQSFTREVQGHQRDGVCSRVTNLIPENLKRLCNHFSRNYVSGCMVYFMWWSPYKQHRLTFISFFLLMPFFPQQSTNLSLPLFLKKRLELVSSNYSEIKQISIAKLK